MANDSIAILLMYQADAEEKKILEFWERDQTFEKSVAERPADKPYVFYDGPPFATGLPHYGHILSSVIKDVVPRYWTMKGYRVRRRWGWDCHGLPIESLIEKELGVVSKKEIEEKIGVAQFNEACRARVLAYAREWKKTITRIGRWVEFDNAYQTMDSTYIESIWWALKNLWERDFIYEGRKVLLYCPHCETPVSKAEVAMDNSYKDITEEAVTVKFKVKGTKVKVKGKRSKAKGHDLPDNTCLLAWTTTPWTLPGNVALAVGPKIVYSLVKSDNEYYLLAKGLLTAIMGDRQYTVIKEFKGSDLVGLEYEPLFDLPAMLATGKKAYYVVAGDFVTTEEGTGVVHTAVIYGEDDYNLGVEYDLPMVPMLNARGEYIEVAPLFVQGEYIKKAEPKLVEYLKDKGLLFSTARRTHSYPHCWRCETPLIYNAISAWFINIQRIKSRLIALNEKINWYPEHLKHGRFLNILETAPDWNISRNRYWASPLPFWKCAKEGQPSCDNIVCIGSVAELKEKAVNFSAVFASDKVEEIDLHKHLVDQIRLKCDKCAGEMARIPEVIDCWVESGSMPYAEFHYPFENKDTFEQRFPGQYIAEYIGQVRAWFYYLHLVSALLFDNISFENVVTTGTILNEQGEKLSKSKQNYPDPWKIIETYGVDALRFYLMTSVVMQADDLFFSEREVRETYNKVINILWNVVTFYLLYAPEYNGKTKAHRSKHILDNWILVKLQVLVKEVSENMDTYNTIKAGRPIKDFIDDLSTWYVRRSRNRFKSDDQEDKQHALATLREVLLTLSKLIAPFTPFIAERIYSEIENLKLEIGDAKYESVHLQSWPKYHEEHHDHTVLEQMVVARRIVEIGLALRAENKIRVRQPLAALLMNKENLSHELLQIIADELNVKHVEFAEYQEPGNGWAEKVEGEISVWLNTAVDEQLKKEGLLREVVRTINQMRKDQKLTTADRVVVKYQTDDKELRRVFGEFGEEIRRAVLAVALTEEALPPAPVIELDAKTLRIALERA